MAEDILWVWYENDATPQDKEKWLARRKLFKLSLGAMRYIEISNAFELIELEEKLRSQGWTVWQPENVEESSMSSRRVLTRWLKTDQ